MGVRHYFWLFIIKIGMQHIVYLNWIDPNISDRRGEAPIHWAASYHNKKIIQTLLDKGADMNVLNKNGHSSLSYALPRNNCDYLRLHNASQFIETIQFLRDRGANPNMSIPLNCV